MGPGVIHGHRDTLGHDQDILLADVPLAPQQIAHRIPVHQLHHKIVDAIREIRIVDLHDAGMFQLRRRPCLFAEAPDILLIGCEG